jgi:hypothetical protein
LSGALAFAQEVTTPVAEVGVNYSFIRHNSAQGGREFTENGGSAYFEYNLNKVVGLVGDLGGYYNGTNSYKSFSYLFGPRFNMRRSRFTPYVQFLFGGTDARIQGTDAAGVHFSDTQNGFTSSAGGGLDIELTRHLSFKPIQLEYVMSQVPQFATNSNSIQNNLRYSAGLVLRLGSK